MKPGYEQMHPGYKLMKSGIDAWRELAKIGSSYIKIDEFNKNWNIYYRPNKDTPRDKWIKCVLIWAVITTNNNNHTLSFLSGTCSIILEGHKENTFVEYNSQDLYNIVLEDN